jgi:hypothetical protein
MIKTIILFTSLFLTNKPINHNVSNSIYESSLPQDCKKLFVALTIFESNWHQNRKAIVTNNFSGFMQKGKLKRFNSLPHYIKFTEGWFKRKHIKNRNHLTNLILSGKYAKLSKQGCRNYLQNLIKIERNLK